MPLAEFAGGEGPADCWVEVEVPSGGEVVCSVDKSFERFIHTSFRGSGVLVMAGGGGELGAKEVFAIHEMDRFAFAERGFELGVVRFPSNNLGIRAAEVRVNNYLPLVWDKHLPDVGQSERRYIRRWGRG